MTEALKQAICESQLSAGEKERLLKELKAVQKALDSAEFRYKRTLIDKEAITNILNASIVEMEMQKAVIGKQKKEAMNRASIDRVRAEIGSMRTIKDLEKITPLIWEELTILKIPFIRSGIVLVHEEEDHKVEIYLSTPDGKAIASIQVPANKTEFTQKIFDHWAQKKVLIDHWSEESFLAWTESLVNLGKIKSATEYLTSQPPQNLYLHFLPFTRGMLYVGSVKPLAEDEMFLLQSLALAFSTAYDRYEDFKKLEAAKQQVENTLQELRSTQKQLIQSEKMASLGELTAGIAHEIQNPLNFVNNFSEVNKELIEELKSKNEKLKIEDEEVNQLINDLKENSEKINQHGKRADAIVKGMLQHSRKNSGQKEPTDINALVDEYVRLSYHGLRAKDKSFNADFKTDLDSSIGKINIVPQDIGRVILNLINNAFYAVNENRKKLGEGYKPIVQVTTHSLSFGEGRGEVKISVKDNGNGIPQNIVDKIFQPFFTTKPTGSGTGLGLSLSYDIIKAHGGEIKVQTKEGEGSEFIIQLPVV